MRRPKEGKKAFLERLMNREVKHNYARSFARSTIKERFSNTSLAAEFDTVDPVNQKTQLEFLKKRSKVIEICASKNVIFALTHAGICAAFDKHTKTRICFLNVEPDQVIRSLFFNKFNNSIITISVYQADNFSRLRCRSTPLEYIKRGQPGDGFPLFESECLRYPGFVEFDDVNQKVLTHSAQGRVFKVWGLVNYDLLYSIEDTNITEVKISPGIMLLIYQRTPSHVPLRILNIENGQVLRSFSHMLHRHKTVDFIEQLNAKLLIKQDSENLQIVDVYTGEMIEVPQTEFTTPSAFIFLYEIQLFLTFKNHQIFVWNFRGELVTKFEDHVLWSSDANTNNIHIAGQQDMILSFCRNGRQPNGAINVSDVLTGRLLAKITAKPEDRRAVNALQDVTALYFLEESNEVITGNKEGRVHMWSS